MLEIVISLLGHVSEQLQIHQHPEFGAWLHLKDSA